MAIYVHIPFCACKCAYCAFYSEVRLHDVDRYIDAVYAEYTLRANEPGATSETIYLGGGTPSLLTERQLERLLAGLPAPLPGAEVTIEVNPDDVTADKARAWRRLGINRVSMGVQSFSNAELRAVGRRHNAEQAVEAYKILRNTGFDNISLDLIIGLPGQIMATLTESIDKLLDMSPEHFSAYMLSCEPDTPLYKRVEKGLVSLVDDDTVADMYTEVCRRAAEAGYEHYEVSNFARPGRRAVHNSLYWQNRPYVGLGSAAHSFDGRDRRYNPESIDNYLAKIESGTPAYDIEQEVETNRINDLILMGLRTADGLDLSMVSAEIRNELLRRARRHPEWFETDGRMLRIPQKHWLMLNTIIVNMLFD